MPPAPYPGFVAGTHVAQSPALANERTVNFYVERAQTPNAKTGGALYPVPGFASFATVSGQTRGRGIFEENGRCFAVVGEAFVEIAADGTVTPQGTVVEGPTGSAARITSNGDAGQQLFVTSGGKGYCFDLLTNTLTEIIASNAAQCDALDGFVFVLDRSDSSLSASRLYNATVFDSFKQRDSRPDPWQAFKVANGLVYLIGERSTDIFYNAGASPFPLEQTTAGALDAGIIAPDSIALLGSTGLMWLGRTATGIGQVFLVRGSTAQDVATHAVRWAINQIRESVGITDAIGESFEYLGHQFYVLTFPAGQQTFVFDVTTGEWVEWLTWSSAEGRYVAWRPHWHVVAHGQHLFCDRTGSDIFRLDPTSALDVTGEPMRRLRRPPTLYNDGVRLTIDNFELQLEAGIAASGVTPMVTLNYSRDGGKTWAQASSPETAGAVGEYRTRVQWPRLGTCRDWQPEIVCSDNYLYRLLGATVTIRPGAGT